MSKLYFSSIISYIFNIILIDYSKSIDKSKEVKDGQRVTISGVGKFIIREIVGNTKSGRYKVKMNKFI